MHIIHSQNVPDAPEPDVAIALVKLTEAELKVVAGGLYSPYPPTHQHPKPPVPGMGV